MISNATKHSILRWIHIIFGIPILGYIYSPFEEIRHMKTIEKRLWPIMAAVLGLPLLLSTLNAGDAPPVVGAQYQQLHRWPIHAVQPARANAWRG